MTSLSGYGGMAMFRADGRVEIIDRVPLSERGSEEMYQEAWMQNLLFQHPEILPIADWEI